MEAVAGQAAIAIENNRMIIQIQKQFEEFVKASVSAIESRDPATSGHSFRVASICREMALTINNINDGYLADVRFTASEIREIELAALLHDFGKVYIDLAVFKKAQKLYPKDFENLMLRMDYLYRFVELNYAAMESRIKDSEFGIDYISRALFAIKEEKANKLKIILDIKSSIQKMNEPAVRAEECGITIDDLGKKINEIDCLGVDGIHMDIMLPCDMNNLAIRSGSLNSEERMEIESHVMHTYGFVSKIPWPPEYKNIPEITIQHHEKINGKGYPRGLLGRESLLIQSRIMAIADIYDALSAGDRPYKKSLTKDKVLAILREESDNGALDPDLVSLFIDKDICGVIYADKF
jgi:HD-GYP domain-containing protein (c-di-GMP phosphodiesterase class II)